MLKLSILFCGALVTVLLGNNQIQVLGVVPANANMQTKMTYVDSRTIQEDIYLQTNHRGLTLSLSIPSSYIWLNDSRIGSRPLDFSNNIHLKPTKVGELIISKSKYLNTLALTISVK